MYYLFDNNRLKPIRCNAEDAIAIAQFCNGILVSNKMEEVIKIAHYSKAAFLLHSKNSVSLFSCWKYQWRYRTLKEFRIIVYAAPKTLLYRLLSFFSLVSFGAYSLIYFPQKKS